jgi:hypothetical protein
MSIRSRLNKIEQKLGVKNKLDQTTIFTFYIDDNLEELLKEFRDIYGDRLSRNLKITCLIGYNKRPDNEKDQKPWDHLRYMLDKGSDYDGGIS